MTGSQIAEWRDYFAEQMEQRCGLPKEGAQVLAEEWLQSVFGENETRKPSTLMRMFFAPKRLGPFGGPRLSGFIASSEDPKLPGIPAREYW
jgi:hypothetical protein